MLSTRASREHVVLPCMCCVTEGEAAGRRSSINLTLHVVKGECMASTYSQSMQLRDRSTRAVLKWSPCFGKRVQRYPSGLSSDLLSQMPFRQMIGGTKRAQRVAKPAAKPHPGWHPAPIAIHSCDSRFLSRSHPVSWLVHASCSDFDFDCDFDFDFGIREKGRGASLESVRETSSLTSNLEAVETYSFMTLVVPERQKDVICTRTHGS